MNNYNKIPTFEQCLQTVEDCKAFSKSVQVVNGKEVFSFKYNLNIDGMWDVDYRINMRGITFVDGKLVALPFPKFFNVGENASTQNLDLSNPKVIFQKMDGSLISFFKLEDKIELKTMKSVNSDVANDCRVHFKQRLDVLQFVMELLDKNYSPIFEYVSPRTRIVINFSEPDLYYLGARNFSTGEIILPNADNYLNRCRSNTIKIPLVYTPDQLESVLLKDDEEGVVVTLQDGTLVKMKTKTYCNLHHLLTEVNPKRVVESLIENKLDDAKSLLYQYGLKDDVNKLEIVEKYYHKKYDAIIKEGQDYLNSNSGKDRKQMAIELFTNPQTKFLGSIVMNLLDNKSCDLIINREILLDVKYKTFVDFL